MKVRVSFFGRTEDVSFGLFLKQFLFSLQSYNRILCRSDSEKTFDNGPVERSSRFLVFTVTSPPLSLSLCNPRMRARPSRSPIFLGLPLLRVAFSTCERWSLVLSHIRATDDFEISRFRAISPSDSPVFSVRNQTLARCLAEIFPVYTITNCETVCSCNRVTVNPLYSLKYCKRDYATKQVLRYDEFKIVAFRVRRKVRYKTPDIFQTCSSYDNSLENPKKHIFSLFKHSKNCVFG